VGWGLASSNKEVRQEKNEQGKTRQEKTGQNKTRQGKASQRQSKTRQDKDEDKDKDKDFILCMILYYFPDQYKKYLFFFNIIFGHTITVVRTH
jgi:hypothetical protein